MKNGAMRMGCWAVLGLLVWLGGWPALAETGVKIEKVQREFQDRYAAANNGGLVTWPDCHNGSAPAYPKDGFYGDIEQDTGMGVLLVQDLVNKFWVSNVVYSSYIKPPLSSLSSFVSTDFPTNFATVNITNSVNVANYMTVLALVRANIRQLVALQPSFIQSPVFATKTVTTSGSVAMSTLSRSDIAAYIQTNLTIATNSASDPNFNGNPYTFYQLYGATNAWYALYKQVQTDVTADFSSILYPGVARIYLKTFYGTLGVTGTPPVSPTNQWVSWQTVNLGTSTSLKIGAGETYNGSVFSSSVFPSNITDYLGWGLSGNQPPSAPGQISTTNLIFPNFGDKVDDIACCTSCPGSCQPGTLTLLNKSAYVAMSLGATAFGKSAGFLLLHETRPSANLSSLNALQLRTRTADGGITNLPATLGTNDTHRQILAPQVLVDIQRQTTNKYMVSFFQRTQVGAQVNSFYATTGSAYSTVTIETPNGNTNLLQVTEARDEVTNTNTFTWTATNQQWELTFPYSLRREAVSRVWNADFSTLTNTLVIKDSNNTVTYKEIQTWQPFAWGLELVQRCVNPDEPSTNGLALLKTTYSYYTDSTDTNNYGLLKQVVDPQQHWERYQYDVCGRLTNTVTQFLNYNTNTSDSANRVTSVGYSPDNSVITTVATVSGREVSRRYTIITSDATTRTVQEIVAQTIGAATNASDNLVTTTTWYTTGQFADELKCVRNADGTLQLYSYVINSNRVNTVSVGQPNAGGTSITNGTKTVTMLGANGQTLSVSSYDIASTLQLSFQTNSSFDSFDRAGRTDFLDGTFQTYTYGCCGVASERTRDGGVIAYGYDSMNRRTSVTRNGITTTDSLNPDGLALTTTRQGTNGSIVSVTNIYDQAGRLRTNYNALGYTNLYTPLALGSDGYYFTQVTNPDGSTRKEVVNQDGTVQQVSDSAVFAVRYEYGVEVETNALYRLYSKEIKQNANLTDTSEWTKTYTDLVGRAYKTVYPDAAFSQSFYNNWGQLTKQIGANGVVKLYAYNGKGELEYTALDMDRNGLINMGASDTDRVVRVTSDVVSLVINNQTNTVMRSQTFVWKDSNATGQLINTREASADGLQTWVISSGIYGGGTYLLTNYTSRSYPSGGGMTVTSIAPDQSPTVSQYAINGVLLSVITPTTSQTYTYDAHGRLNTLWDALQGTTTYSYDNADQMTTTVNAAGQTTLNYFDVMGRVWKTTLPDNTSVTNEFYLTGLPKKSYGSRTYPVAYGYDYAGRVKTMMNWGNYTNNTGARVTTWNYDPQRGFLTSKWDNSSKGPTYDYTTTGFLSTRSLVGGQTNNYSYNNAGELINMTNSGGSTAPMGFGYDRLGRQTVTTYDSITTTRVFNDANLLESESYSGGTMNGLGVNTVYDSVLRSQSTSANGQISIGYLYDSASRLVNIGANGYSTALLYVANSSSLIGSKRFNRNGAQTSSANFTYGTNQIGTPPESSYYYSTPAILLRYANNNAGQRVVETSSVENYRWVYGYDPLGQVTNATKCWGANIFETSIVPPVPGQQFAYSYDDIGNRLSTTVGGDATGQNLRSATYYPTLLNQYSSNTVPGYTEVQGAATVNATVTVNAQSVTRYGEYYRAELAVNNATGSVWLPVTNLAIVGLGGTNADIIATNIGNKLIAPATQSFTYDVEGNLQVDGLWSYQWDGANRLRVIQSLTNVPPAARRSVTNTYDAQGRRIRKTVGTWNSGTQSYQVTSDVKFLYDGWNVVAELNGTNNAVLRSYVWGNDLSGTRQGAGGVGGLLMMYDTATAMNYFYAYDANGNVRALIKGLDGTQAAAYEYGPFGELLRAEGPMAYANHFRFSTKYQDDETDLYYYGYRFYSPTTGRWLSKDPIGEDGGRNLYGFVYNNPQRYADRDGRDPFSPTPNGINSVDVVVGSPIFPPASPNSGGTLFEWSPRVQTHSIQLTFKKGPCCDCAKLQKQIYDRLKGFKDWGDNSFSTLSIQQTYIGGQGNWTTAYFTAGGSLEADFLGVVGSLPFPFPGNDRSVGVNLSYNDDNSTVTGTTLGNHMLVGKRTWSVSRNEQSTSCSLTVSTREVAYDRNFQNAIGFKIPFIGGKRIQNKIWTEYLNNIGSEQSKSPCFINKGQVIVP